MLLTKTSCSNVVSNKFLVDFFLAPIVQEAVGIRNTCISNFDLYCATGTGDALNCGGVIRKFVRMKGFLYTVMRHYPPHSFTRPAAPRTNWDIEESAAYQRSGRSGSQNETQLYFTCTMRPRHMPASTRPTPSSTKPWRSPPSRDGRMTQPPCTGTAFSWL